MLERGQKQAKRVSVKKGYSQPLLAAQGFTSRL